MDLLEGGLVDVSLVVRIGETDRTVHVAPVGEVDVCDGRTGQKVEPLSVNDHVDGVVPICDSTVHCVMESDSIVCILLGSEVHIHIGPVDIAVESMLGAGLLDEDLAVLCDDVGFDNLTAVRAEGLGLLGETFPCRILN